MYFDPEFAPDPKGPAGADVGSGRTSRDPVTREEGGKEGSLNLGYDLFIVGAFYQDVRHSSAFVLAEIQIEPHSVSVPLTGAE